MSNPLPELDKECFVISPFGSEGSPERERADDVLEFIIGRAAEELGLTAVRADQLAEPGQITLQVIDHVLGARAAVADLTGLSPNVFYELAVRHTARLPVALIAENDCELPFDIAQMRTIFFDSTRLKSSDKCRRDIVAHLRRALDHGAVDSPIATSADVRALAGGSVTERSIAEIVTTVEYIAKMQRNISESIDHLRTDGYVPDDDAELVGAIDRVMGLAAGLELASTEHLAPENEQLREQIHELNELLESARQVVWKKGHRRSRRGGTRPTIRSVVEGDALP
jgi:hypothetical protein